MERLTWHSASPTAGRYIVHGLDPTRDRVAVIPEVSANLCSRFIDTLLAHNATAGMNPKAVFGVGLPEQGRTLDGIEFYKNLIEVTHKQFRGSCLHKCSSLSVAKDNLTKSARTAASRLLVRHGTLRTYLIPRPQPLSQRIVVKPRGAPSEPVHGPSITGKNKRRHIKRWPSRVPSNWRIVRFGIPYRAGRCPSSNLR